MFFFSLDKPPFYLPHTLLCTVYFLFIFAFRFRGYCQCDCCVVAALSLLGDSVDILDCAAFVKFAFYNDRTDDRGRADDRRPRMFDQPDQVFRRKLSDLLRVLADRRELRLDVPSDPNPVVTRYRDVIRDLKPSLPYRIDPAKTREIIRVYRMQVGGSLRSRSSIVLW